MPRRGRREFEPDPKERLLLHLEASDRRPTPTFQNLRTPFWTENKARLIERYLKVFLMITKNGIYIGCFEKRRLGLLIGDPLETTFGAALKECLAIRKAAALRCARDRQEASPHAAPQRYPAVTPARGRVPPEVVA